jgi:hypothetical protein
MSRSVVWLHTDVSGLHIGPTFKGQNVQDEEDILTTEDGTDT